MKRGGKDGYMYRKRERGEEKTDKVVEKVKQEQWTEIE